MGLIYYKDDDKKKTRDMGTAAWCCLVIYLVCLAALYNKKRVTRTRLHYYLIIVAWLASLAFLILSAIYVWASSNNISEDKNTVITAKYGVYGNMACFIVTFFK